jgi:multicomponent Na+:H+ antiporter subunit G
MIGTIIVGALVIGGASLVALAGVGILRLPDPLTRASAVSKAAALGLLVIIFAAIIDDWSPRTVVVLVLILIAHLVTVPLSGLALARAAYRSGTARPPVTTVDEPAERGRRDADTRAARQEERPNLALPDDYQ